MATIDGDGSLFEEEISKQNHNKNSRAYWEIKKRKLQHLEKDKRKHEHASDRGGSWFSKEIRRCFGRSSRIP